MIHLISFTSLFSAIVRGDLKISDLLRPDIRIHFGCTRGHLFGDDPSDVSLAPMEVSWANINMRSGYSGQCDDSVYWRLRADKVDPDVWQIWLAFHAAILQAMEENRVVWQCGNYPELVDQLTAKGETAFQMGRHKGEEWRAIFGAAQ